MANAIDKDGNISIHSPHAGRDYLIPFSFKKLNNFNPLSPCGERLPESMRRKGYPAISIHSPHAGRDVSTIECPAVGAVISIHSPHAGRDFALTRS